MSSPADAQPPEPSEVQDLLFTVNELAVEDEVDEADETPSLRYSITSYGADYPVDGLVKRMSSSDIHVPSFQRAYVWSVGEASRFVESLLLGLPVPGVFLAKEDESNRLLVIDGQQRLRTLQYFYKMIFEPTGRKFTLQNVDRRFEGKTYEQLEEGDRRNLDDAIIHATVIRQDVPSDDSSSIYHVFERLNNGGKQLYPQEIRAALYHGKFNDLLDELNQNQSWRSVFGAISRRLRDQELILRFLAFRYSAATYEKPLKDFLNRFMRQHQHITPEQSATMSAEWNRAINLVVNALDGNAFKPRGALNSAFMDAFLVALSETHEANPEITIDTVVAAYSTVMESNDFLAATTRHTSDEEVVALRLRLAREAFVGALE